jgi:hypothetical protein
MAHRVRFGPYEFIRSMEICANMDICFACSRNRLKYSPCSALSKNQQGTYTNGDYRQGSRLGN